MRSYLVTASDPLLLRERVAELMGDREVESYYAGDISLRELAARVSTLDLFSSARGFWLKDINALQATKKTKRELAMLATALPGDAVLVFSQDTYFGGDWLAQRRFEQGALRRAVAEVVDQQVEASVHPRKLAGWVRQRAEERYGLKLAAYQVDTLIDVCADLPSLIDGELKKLALLKTREGDTISENWFKIVLARTWSYSAAKIADAVLARRTDAYRFLLRIYRRESIIARLLPELYRGLLRLYWIRSDPDFRSRPEFRRVGWRLEKLQEAARRWRREALLKALTVVTDTAFRLRTGRMGGRTPQEAERDLLLLMLRRLYAL